MNAPGFICVALLMVMASGLTNATHFDRLRDMVWSGPSRHGSSQRSQSCGPTPVRVEMNVLPAGGRNRLKASDLADISFLETSVPSRAGICVLERIGRAVGE